VRKPRVLVVDDGLTYAEVISGQMPEFDLVDPGQFGSDGRIEDGVRALEFLKKKRREVDVVALDMNFDIDEDRLLVLDENTSTRRTRRFQGIAILRAIRAGFSDLPVVLLTSIDDLSLVEAADEFTSQSMIYFLGTDDLDALRIRINSAWQEVSVDFEESRVLWGADPQMRAVHRRLDVLAQGRTPVILEGETGTGKSFLAEHFIHKRSGRRGPFVVCDLATVPNELISAHLFGAIRGAYTGSVADRKGVFETAHRGTVFIDEIQNIPLEVQKQLLQVLQERRLRPLGSAREMEVDVKVIAASNRPLDEAVDKGLFRSDLYMRLSPATRVRIPSLKERPGDLEFLASRFIKRAADDPDVIELAEQVARAGGLAAEIEFKFVIGHDKKTSVRVPGVVELLLPEPAWKMLKRHSWPGNMRELDNVMHNIVVFTLIAAVDAVRQGISIGASRLQVDPGLIGELLEGSARLGDGASSAGGSDNDPQLLNISVEPAKTLNMVANSVERQYFLQLFKSSGGDFVKMADRLLGDTKKARAVRLRFNQLGLKVRDIPRG
jgi:DNA-binding NtrC family response regulator